MSVRRRRRNSGILLPAFGLWLEPAATNYLPNTVLAASYSAAVGGEVISDIPVGVSATHGKRVVIAGASGYAQTGALASTLTAQNVASVLWKSGGTGVKYWFNLIDSTAAVSRANVRWEADASGAPILIELLAGNGYEFHAVPSLGAGWYRLSVYSTTYAVTNQSYYAVIGINAGSAGKYLDFALPQLEATTVASSPIPNNTAGSISRGKDDFTSADTGALWAATSGMFVEDATRLMRTPDALNNLTVCSLFKTGGLQVDQNVLQYMDSSVDRIAFEAVASVVATAGAGAGNNRADYIGYRSAGVIRATGGNIFLHMGGAQRSTVADATANMDTLVRRIQSMRAATGQQMAALLHQVATYNADLGAAVANTISGPAGDLPATNQSKIFDFRGGSLPAPITFARTTTALNEDLSVAAINAPRFARYGL